MIADRAAPRPPISTTTLRVFGLTTGAAFAIAAGMLVPFLRHAPRPSWPWIVAGAFWIVAIVAPRSLLPLHRVATKFGHRVAMVQARILLGLAFFVVVVPVGLLMQIVRRRRVADENPTTYRTRSQPRTRESMERPF